MSSSTARIIRLAAVTAALAGAAPPAFASDSFSGRCAGHGPVTIDPPVTWKAAPTELTARYRGTCTGTLNGEPVRDVPFRSRATASGVLSCAGGVVAGGGRLVFRLPHRRRVALDARLENLNLASEAAFVLRGRDGGIGSGMHTLVPDSSMLPTCFSGGLPSAVLTVAWASAVPMRG